MRSLFVPFSQVSSVLSQDLRRLKLHLLQSVLEENRQPLKIVDRPQSSDHLLARYASMHRWSQLRQHVCEGVKDILPPSPPPPPTAAALPSASSPRSAQREESAGGGDLPPASAGSDQVGGRLGNDGLQQHRGGGGGGSNETTIAPHAKGAYASQFPVVSSSSSTSSSSSAPQGKQQSSHVGCSPASRRGGTGEGEDAVPPSDKSSQANELLEDHASSSSSSASCFGGETSPPVRLLDSCVPPEKQKESYSQRRQLYESKALQVSSATDANVCALLLQEQQKLQHQLGCLTDPVASVAGAAGWGLGSMGVATATASEVERRLLLVLSSASVGGGISSSTCCGHDDFMAKERGGGRLGESPGSLASSPMSSREAGSHSSQQSKFVSSPAASSRGGLGTLTRGETGSLAQEAATQHSQRSVHVSSNVSVSLPSGEETQRAGNSSKGAGGGSGGDGGGGGGLKGGVNNFELSVNAFLAHGEEEERRLREKKQPVYMAPGVVNPRGGGDSSSLSQSKVGAASSAPLPSRCSPGEGQTFPSSAINNSHSSQPQWVRKDRQRGGGGHCSTPVRGHNSHTVPREDLLGVVVGGREEHEKLSETDGGRPVDLPKRAADQDQPRGGLASTVPAVVDTTTRLSESGEDGKAPGMSVEEKDYGEGGEKKEEQEIDREGVPEGSPKKRAAGEPVGSHTSTTSGKGDTEEGKQDEKNDGKTTQEDVTDSSSTSSSSLTSSTTATGTSRAPPTSSIAVSSSSSSSSPSRQVSVNDKTSASSSPEREDADGCKDSQECMTVFPATSKTDTPTRVATSNTAVCSSASNTSRSMQEKDSLSSETLVSSAGVPSGGGEVPSHDSNSSSGESRKHNSQSAGPSGIAPSSSLRPQPPTKVDGGGGRQQQGLRHAVDGVVASSLSSSVAVTSSGRGGEGTTGGGSFPTQTSLSSSGEGGGGPNGMVPATTGISSTNSNTTGLSILDGMAGGTTGGGGLCSCCCVCWLSERSNLNPILSCLRCLVTVHKNCYGVGKTGEAIEGDDWICRRCEFEKKGLGTQWMLIFEPMKIQCQVSSFR